MSTTIDYAAIVKRTEEAMNATLTMENNLVEENFPNCRQCDFNELSANMAAPICWSLAVVGCNDVNDMANLISSTACSAAVKVLGTDLAEVVFFRLGALRYMYAHTIINDPNRMPDLNSIDSTPDHFFTIMIEGVQFLNAFRSLRSPIDDDIVIRKGSEDTHKLLKLGLFSDTHVLGIMYSAELNYWLWRLRSPYGDTSEHTVDLLKKFLVAANHLPGWDIIRAKKLLEEVIRGVC